MDATDLYVEIGDWISELLAVDAEAEWVKVETTKNSIMVVSDIFKITIKIEEK